MTTTPSSQASAWRHLPNLISGLRIVLVAPLLLLIASERYEAALAVAVVAGVSDGVDGYLARRFRWHVRPQRRTRSTGVPPTLRVGTQTFAAASASRTSSRFSSGARSSGRSRSFGS